MTGKTLNREKKPFCCLGRKTVRVSEKKQTKVKELMSEGERLKIETFSLSATWMTLAQANLCANIECEKCHLTAHQTNCHIVCKDQTNIAQTRNISKIMAQMVAKVSTFLLK